MTERLLGGPIVAIADPDDPNNVFKPVLLNGELVTKSDVTVFDPPASALWVGGAGDVAVRFYGNQNSEVLTAVPAGTWLPFAVDQVLSTGTTATLIVRMW